MTQTDYPFIKVKIFPFNLSSLKGTIKGNRCCMGSVRICEP